MKNGSIASSGFQALADYDDNKDGKIDVNDSIFGQLKVWKDTNGDGIASENELLLLNDLGIKAINLSYTNTNTQSADGNIQVRVGTYEYTDGTTRSVGEYQLNRDTYNTISKDPVDIPADIAGLPNISGSGEVYSLHEAMARDTSGDLKNLITAF